MIFKKFLARHGRFFITTFLSLIMVSAVPLILLFTLIYNSLLNDYKIKVLETNGYRLTMSKSRIDSIFMEFSRSALKFSLSSDIPALNSILSDKYMKNAEDALTVRRTSNLLSDLAITYSEIDDTLIYYPIHQRFISKGSFSYVSEVDDTQWLSGYDENNRNIQVYKTETLRKTPAITFMYPISSYTSGVNACFFIIIRSDQLLTDFKNDVISESGILFVMNQNGEIIWDSSIYKSNTSISDIDLMEAANKIDENDRQVSIKINGAKYLIAHDISDTFGFRYFYVSREDEVIGNVNLYKWMISGIVFALIMACTVVSYILAIKIYNPVKNLVARIKNHSAAEIDSDTKNELVFISYSLDTIMEDEKKLTEQLKSYDEELKKSLIFSFMMGNLVTENSSNLPAGNFTCMILSIDHYQHLLETYSSSELYSIKLFIRKVCDNIICEDGFCSCYIVSENKIAIILKFSDETGYLHNKCIAIQSQILTKNIGASFGLTESYNKIEDVHICYKEAMEAVNYKFIYGCGSITVYGDIKNRQSRYYYPEDIEVRILNCMNSLHADSVLEALEDFLLKLKTMEDLSYHSIWNALYQLTGSSVSYLMSIEINTNDVYGPGCNLFKTLGACETITDFKEFLTDFFQRVIAYKNSENRSAEKKLMEKVIRYLRENYNDQDMSIQKACDHLDIGYALMRKMLCEGVGMNFINYLNRLRVDNAKELLASSELTNVEIAEAIGYNNDLGFTRNFKKYTGITPGEYKRSLKK